ncbi:MAG TPA: STAS domain-containing protein [Actinospica sp.]|jgi:anti-sigma B factor antagonist|nr:STAS domain-containing protein [Actinospica sp.]
MKWSDPSAAIRVAVEEDTASTVVHAAGELDELSAPVFERVLPDCATLAERVVLDLSRVTFCSVAGLRALTRLRERTEAGGRLLEVRRPNRAVRRVFELSGLSESWDLGPAPEEAVAGHGAQTALLTGVLQAALCATGALMGTAQYYDRSTGTLRIVAHQGFGYRFVSFFETVEGRSTTCGSAALDLQPVFVDDVTASPIFAGTPELDALLEASVGCVASLPIVSSARTLIGVVSTHQRQPGSWSADHRAAFADIGGHATQLAGV